jgi:replication initiation protein RepC
VRDRALSVINALLSFYPQTNLVDGRKLVVFPSNAQLTVRANGIAGTTLRENLAIPVNAGMVHRKDSANG